MLDLTAEVMTQVYGIKATYKRYKMGRWSFQKMMHWLTVSLHHMFLFVMMRSLSKKLCWNLILNKNERQKRESIIIGIVEWEEYQSIFLAY